MCDDIRERKKETSERRKEQMYGGEVGARSLLARRVASITRRRIGAKNRQH